MFKSSSSSIYNPKGGHFCDNLVLFMYLSINIYYKLISLIINVNFSKIHFFAIKITILLKLLPLCFSLSSNTVSIISCSSFWPVAIKNLSTEQHKLFVFWPQNCDPWQISHSAYTPGIRQTDLGHYKLFFGTFGWLNFPEEYPFL